MPAFSALRRPRRPVKTARMSERVLAARQAKVRLLADQKNLEVQQHRFALTVLVARLERAARTVLIARLTVLAERDDRFGNILKRLTR
jgi:hypothetical protein